MNGEIMCQEKVEKFLEKNSPRKFRPQEIAKALKLTRSSVNHNLSRCVYWGNVKYEMIRQRGCVFRKLYYYKKKVN